MDLTPSATTRLQCPLKSCGWSYDDPGPTITIYDDPSLLATSYFMNLDQVARVHLETHSLEDWVTEVARLQGDLAAEKPLVKTVAATLRYAAEFADWGKQRDDMLSVAARVEALTAENDDCCPVCEETTCDDGCPLAAIRARWATGEPS